jgi:predicted permease
MDRLLQDVRFAFRALRKNKGFTTVAVITLALGIGLNSANFSIVHSLLAKPVDLPGLDTLAVIHETATTGGWEDVISPRAWLDYQEQSKAFEQIAAIQWWSVNLTGVGLPEQVLAFQVSPEFFPIVNTPAALGRTFAPDEREGKNEKVCVLSDGLWRRRYGADPGVVGKAVTIDGASYTVVGVMPKSYRFPSGVELWAPLVLTPKQRADRGARYLRTVGRLRPGVSVEQASSEIAALGERQSRDFPLTNGGRRLRVLSLVRGTVEETTVAFIWTLMFAGSFVLAIACANIASMLLARAQGRRREMAVRAALGAGRWRIVRQLLTESVLLGVIAGAVSLLLAAWAIDFVKGAIPPTITRYIPGWDKLGLDKSVLAFTGIIAFLVSILFGLAPALEVARTQVGEVLKESGRSLAGGRRTQRLRSTLVVIQVSLALVLLVCAGVLSKGFYRQANPRRGLESRGVLTAAVALPDARYPSRDSYLSYGRRAIARLRGLPGVEDVGITNNLPWGESNEGRSLQAEGSVPRSQADLAQVEFRTVSPGYLELLKIPLLQGRTMGSIDDAPDAPKVAVLSASAAQRIWPGEEAVGKRFRLGGDQSAPWVTVIGIVGDVYHHYMRSPPSTVYVPFAQSPFAGVYFAVRTQGDPLALANAARVALADVDAQLPVFEVRTLEQLLADRVAGTRLGSQMMGAFALLALILSAVGVYGVIAFLVAQRTQEIGIRLALGAGENRVLRMVMSRGAKLAAWGVGVGLPCAILVVRALQQALPDMVDADVSVFVAFTAVVVVMALCGSLLPARRAMRIDPMVALRSE